MLEAVRLKGTGVPPIEMTPLKVRLSLKKGAPPLHVGDRILVLANLSPQPEQALSISGASSRANRSTSGLCAGVGGDNGNMQRGAMSLHGLLGESPIEAITGGDRIVVREL